LAETSPLSAPLGPGDRAPDVVLDVATKDGRIALADFRGQKPLLVGLFRGLHCPFCRRHLAAQALIDRELRAKGVESLAVVNTPIERARLFFRYHPMPDLLAAADPERVSHRAFGLPNLDFAHGERGFHHTIRVATTAAINVWDGYRKTDADRQTERDGAGQLFGQFLIDRDGIIRWRFTDVPAKGCAIQSRPNPQELFEEASRVAA
jgi:peroxiredoxin